MKAQTPYVTALRAMQEYRKPKNIRKRHIMKRLIFAALVTLGLSTAPSATAYELDCADMSLGEYDFTHVSKNRPTRNNNPGNIRKTGRTYYGETNSDREYESFAAPEWGYAAMFDLLDRHYDGLTMSQAIHKWAPKHENDTEAYIRFVAKKSGLDRDKYIVDVLDAKIIQLVKWMSVREGMKGFEDADVKLGWYVWGKCYRN